MWGNTQTAGKTSALHSCWPKGGFNKPFHEDGWSWMIVCGLRHSPSAQTFTELHLWRLNLCISVTVMHLFITDEAATPPANKSS